MGIGVVADKMRHYNGISAGSPLMQDLRIRAVKK
jgi:hypothetical protein